LYPLGYVPNTDPIQTEQVIIKLAANARDAMGLGGSLTIGVTPFASPWHGLAHPGRYALLSVGASDWMINEEARNHVFEPSLARKREGRVIGMELPAVYGIIKQNGGHINVESGPGQGTTFQIYFPLVDSGFAGGAIAPPRAIGRGRIARLATARDSRTIPGTVASQTTPTDARLTRLS
jgi:two-component system cell cycle sensor histidine kinase/response regulator CckA